jgi:hypothetical protein
VNRQLKIGLIGFVVVVLVVLLFAGGAAVYISRGPAYALAKLVTAAHEDDRRTIEKGIDIDRMVADFVPQVEEAAIEIYGRGLPEIVVKGVAALVTPLKPAIKEKIGEMLPSMLRDNTHQSEGVPTTVLAIGLMRELDFDTRGEISRIRSKNPGDTFELLMQKTEGEWKVVAVRDPQLAREVAETIGAELFSAAISGDVGSIGSKFGINDLKSAVDAIDSLLK